MALKTGQKTTETLLASLKTAFDKGIMRIYSGPRPASCNDAETGTLLCTITKDGAAYTEVDGTNGLEFNAPATTAGVSELLKKTGDVWADLAADGTGQAAWYRFFPLGAGKTGASTTVPRVDGSVGTTSSYDLQMLNLTVNVGEPVYIQNFKWTMPNGE